MSCNAVSYLDMLGSPGFHLVGSLGMGRSWAPHRRFYGSPVSPQASFVQKILGDAGGTEKDLGDSIPLLRQKVGFA